MSYRPTLWDIIGSNIQVQSDSFGREASIGNSNFTNLKKEIINSQISTNFEVWLL